MHGRGATRPVIADCLVLCFACNPVVRKPVLNSISHRTENRVVYEINHRRRLEFRKNWPGAECSTPGRIRAIYRRPSGVDYDSEFHPDMSPGPAAVSNRRNQSLLLVIPPMLPSIFVSSIGSTNLVDSPAPISFSASTYWSVIVFVPTPLATSWIFWSASA